MQKILPSIGSFTTSALKAALLMAAISSAPAQTLYWGGGNSDIENGTPLPATLADAIGTWSDTTSNWSTNGSGSVYQAWNNDGSYVANFGTYTTGDGLVKNVTISGDKNVNCLFLSLAHNNNNQERLQLVADIPTKLTLSAGSVIEVTGNVNDLNQGLVIGPNVNLTGTNGFRKTGSSWMGIGSVSDLSGDVILDQGFLNIGVSSYQVTPLTGGTLNKVMNFYIGNAGANAGQGTRLTLAGTGDKVNDDATIHLSGLGQLVYMGANNTTEVVGKLVVNSSGALVVNTSVGEGTPVGRQITFQQGIERSNDRAQLIFQGNAMGVPTATTHLGVNTHGDGLQTWISNGNTSQFYQIDSSNNIVLAEATDTSAISDITSSTGSTNFRYIGGSDTFGADAEVNTLGIYASADIALNVTGTLNIVAGGLVNSRNSLTFNGGAITTDADALYINSGMATGGKSVTFNSALVGSMDVALTGNIATTYGGTLSNTYTGTTYVNGGTLQLNKTAGATAISGNVVVRNLAMLKSQMSNQIDDSASVHIEAGGVWRRDPVNGSETISKLSGAGTLFYSNTAGASRVIVTDELAPGDNGIGTLVNDGTTTSSSVLELTSTATLKFELAGDGSSADKVSFWRYNSGELVLNENQIDLTLIGMVIDGTYTVTLFDFYSDQGVTGVASGITTGLVLGTMGEGITDAEIIYGTDKIQLSYTVTAVPEPSTILLLIGAGAVCYGIRMRTRRSI